MGWRMGVLLTSVFIVSLATNAEGQQVRGEVSLTTERQGVSINSDARFYQAKYQLFALARIFINEPDGSLKQPMETSTGSLTIEAAVGRFFMKGSSAVGPLAGVDSDKRVLTGASLVTKLRLHSLAYLGYVRFATDSRHTNGTRHRLLFDLKKNEKVFLRLDWKTEGDRNEHCRLGVEFDARINRLNLPVYIEPFWDFAPRQIGVRVGLKL